MTRRRISPLAVSVRRAIEAREWTISELARRSNVHRVTLSRYLGGHQTISADKIESILSAFNMLGHICQKIETGGEDSAGTARKRKA